MLKSFKPVVRVPFLRTGLIVASLVVLPSWTISALKNDDGRTAEVVAAPVGEAHAEAQAAGVAPVRKAKPAVSLAEAAWDKDVVERINPEVLGLALNAASCAVRSGAVEAPKTLTIIDYSKPSAAKRLWVLDLKKRDLLYEELVAHGQGTGANYATMFSNEPETHRTSLGLFVTDDTYVGKNGYSLRLNGLDAGFNDRARERAIVMHGAPYVNDDFVKAQGRLGRSWGCPALRDGVAREVIDTVKGGSLVFAYYPDQNWLKSSKYLGGCSAAN